MKFKSHPVEVDAWEFRPGTRNNDVLMHPDVKIEKTVDDWSLWVEKSQQWCLIEPGDYVIAEPDGTGFYPCKRKIFLVRYYRQEDKKPVNDGWAPD